MGRHSRQGPPLTPGVLTGRNVVLNIVLAALDEFWGVNAPGGPLIDPPHRGQRKLLEHADAMIEWLSRAVDALLDKGSPPAHRFRRAWLLAPTTVIGQDLDEAVIREVALGTTRTIERLRQLRQALHDGNITTAQGQELDRLLKACESPPRPPDEWAYVVEAVRAGAEDLPSLTEMFQPGSEAHSLSPVDPAPFVAVVLDAMLPGAARALDVDIVRNAVRVWKRRGALDPKNAWELLTELVRPLRCQISALSMSRKWTEVLDRVRLNRSAFVTVLAPGQHDLNPMNIAFTPNASLIPVYVRMMRRAVRSAMPRRKLDAKASSPLHAEIPTSLPDEFLTEATALLPPRREGQRGRRPLPAATVLQGLLDYLNSTRTWEELEYGRTIEGYFGKMKRNGTLEKVANLAAKFGLLSNTTRARRYRQAPR